MRLPDSSPSLIALQINDRTVISIDQLLAMDFVLVNLSAALWPLSGQGQLLTHLCA